MSGWRTYGLIKRYAYYELVLESTYAYSRVEVLYSYYGYLVVVLLKIRKRYIEANILASLEYSLIKVCTNN